jgi:hypothetical protein
MSSYLPNTALETAPYTWTLQGLEEFTFCLAQRTVIFTPVT